MPLPRHTQDVNEPQRPETLLSHDATECTYSKVVRLNTTISDAKPT
jgi:hypothetical protein